MPKDLPHFSIFVLFDLELTGQLMMKQCETCIFPTKVPVLVDLLTFPLCPGRDVRPEFQLKKSSHVSLSPKFFPAWTKSPLTYLMLLVRPVSGSTALTLPTVQAGGQFSDTSMWYRDLENLGGSSASSTATRMEARSLKGPRRRKRGSTMGLRTSTEKE